MLKMMKRFGRTAQNGHTETVKLLLNRGANLHALNDEAIINAAENGHTETVKLLLQHHADVHAGNGYPLYWAAIKGNPEMVKLLLEKGATITPFIRRLVEERGNPEIIALFNQS